MCCNRTATRPERRRTGENDAGIEVVETCVGKLNPGQIRTGRHARTRTQNPHGVGSNPHRPYCRYKLFCRINAGAKQKAAGRASLPYTNGYTNAPLQCFAHPVSRLVSHARQHAGVGVQGDRCGGLPEELLDDLGTHALAGKERGARVPEVVGAGLLGRLCA